MKNIIFIDWDCFGREGMLEALKADGFDITFFQYDKKYVHSDENTEKSLTATMRESDPEFVFSFNYFPIISNVCQKEDVLYVSWVYDSPLVLLYSCTLINPCNRVFIFDKEQFMEFYRGGIRTVFYLPLAAKPLDLQTLDECAKETLQLSFVGSMYTEDHDFCGRLTGISDFTRGYLEGIINAQIDIYGTNFIKNMLKPSIIEDMQKSLPLKPNPDGAESLEYLFAEYVINRRITGIERGLLLSEAAKIHPVTLYTTDSTFRGDGIDNRGIAPYGKGMYEIFRGSRINLNITLRSIHSGVPLRCFDIMAAGGFLLSNFQSDFQDCFVEGEEMVTFSDREDMKDKIDYYLKHEDERSEIALAGYDAIKERHTFKHRLEEILCCL